MDDPGNGSPQTHKGVATVAGIWFGSTTNGDVGLLPGESVNAGAVEHLSSATAVDAIALSGVGAGDSQQDDAYNALWMVDGKLYANSSTFGDSIHVSTDGGKSFQQSGSSATGIPNAMDLWLSKDSSGTFHLVDEIGNVWFSPTPPSATASWTRTWQPEGSPPDPNPVPAADCQKAWHNDYFPDDPQQAFWVSPDGQTMIYNNAEEFIGVCRSTDGGKNFVPVEFPNPPNGTLGAPYAILFTSATHGLAAYASGTEAANTAYVYTTDDAGASWTAATLPSALTSGSAEFAITNAFAAPDGQHVWLGGFSDSGLLLLKSSDAGKTWKDVSAAVNAADKGGSAQHLHSGFALDANNIWIGGENGFFAYSATGGE